MLGTIKWSSSGNLVKIAQYMSGYSEMNKASGNFDAAFFDYVKEWQEKNGLMADGIIGPATWTKLADVAPTCSTSKNKKCAHVCAIQLILGGLTVDGDYGSKTKKAVAAFQSANGMEADGKTGPKTWKKLVVGDGSSSGDDSGDSSGGDSTPSGDGGVVVNKKPVDYKQYDSKWGKIKYSTHTSSQTIANSGCGPTSMADIVATWWNKKITPKELCKLSVDNGYRTYDSGTAWGFFGFCAKKYKAAKFIQTTSIATLKASLQQGAYAVVSFRPSKWTKGGFDKNGRRKTW